jgi:hypothetical protein
MKLKRRAGGHILDREYYDAAKPWRKPSERLAPLGPFKIDGKDFVAVVYFDRWSYWKWMLKYGMVLLISFFYPSYYLKATSLATKAKGVVILDNNIHFVSDKTQQIRVARTALVWIDVYLCPAFPPRLFNLVDMKMKLEKKVFEQCKDRKVPKAKEPAEKLYLEELRRADKQVVKFHPIFVKYHRSLRNATNLFKSISDRPSEANVMKLKPVIERIVLNFEELAKWSEERAKSWTNFVDSFELYRKSEEKKKSLLKRYGPAAIWKVLMSIFAHVLSGGNFAFSVTFSLVSWFGIEGFKMILSFRWQATTLKKTAHIYRQFSARAKTFLKLYDMPLRKGFLR